MVKDSFLEKPALAMNLNDLVDGINIARLTRKELAEVLAEKGIKGDVTTDVVRQFKSKTFSSVGTLTVEGLMDIYFDLKVAGLPRHATIKNYMSCVAQSIRKAS